MSIATSSTVAAKLASRSRRDPQSGCRLWLRKKDKDGYGRIDIGGKQFGAHRLTWEEENGPIPDGMLVCHTCDTPACIEASHLFLGTHIANMADMAAKGRAVSPFGEDVHTAKLSVEAVREIRASAESTCVLARRYGVNRSAIKRIRNGTQWRRALSQADGVPA